jgi:membrane carboxypeptidase/penicillin-binding protein
MDQDPNTAGHTKISLTGATSALPIWSAFMKQALEGVPPSPFPISPQLVSVRIDRHSGRLATSSCPDAQSTIEKYVVGNDPRDPGCEPLWPESPPETREE